MFEQPQQILVQLPHWLSTFATRYEPTDDIGQQMTLVLAATRENIARESGGPFGAGVFDATSGDLIALGVNLVTTEKLSALHAEMVAIALAQRKLGTYDLSQAGSPLRLVCSTEPCAMCLGAIPWSGIAEVVTAARDADARAVGFDEGAKPDDWIGSLEHRGIRVTTDVMRDRAESLLREYQASAGILYNPGY